MTDPCEGAVCLDEEWYRASLIRTTVLFGDVADPYGEHLYIYLPMGPARCR